MINATPNTRLGLFTLLEIVPVFSLILVLAGVFYVVVNPIGNMQDARNVKRESHIIFLADAIAEHARDKGMTILSRVPIGSSVEICAKTSDVLCGSLLNINVLMGSYIDAIPVDTSWSGDSKNTRYFIERLNSQHFRIYAPDTEGDGVEDVTVKR